MSRYLGPMRPILALLACLVAFPARAMTDPMAGVLFTLAPGGTAGISPGGFYPGWDLSAMAWWGRYDDVYALGRFNAIGVTGRQAWIEGALRTVPALEFRRGNDVVVVGYYGFLSVGPDLGDGPVGVEALLGGGLKYRFTPRWGTGLRVGAGPTYKDGDWGGRVIVRAFLEFAAPFRKLE